jgi:hypothetical protein
VGSDIGVQEPLRRQGAIDGTIGRQKPINALSVRENLCIFILVIQNIPITADSYTFNKNSGEIEVIGVYIR